MAKRRKSTIPDKAHKAVVTVRPAIRADVTALVDLDRRSFPAADRFSQRIWEHLLGPAAQNRSALTVVGEREGQIIGAANVLLRANSKVIRLYTLAVDPQARGLGLAKQLMAAVLTRCPRRCRIVSLEVRADNPARALYERWGLTVIADLPGYYHDGANGVRMRAERSVVEAAVAP